MTHRYRRPAGLFLLAVLLGVPRGCLGAEEGAPEALGDKIAAPVKTWYEGRAWRYDPAWKDEEIHLEADLDQDGEDEVVIGYVGCYRPPTEREEGPRMFEIPKKEIPIIENRIFYKIYDRDPGGHWECVRTLTGLDRPGEVHVVWLDRGEAPGLLIISPGGKTYRDISLYQWREGGYRLLDTLDISQPFSIGNQPVFHIKIPGERTIISWDPEKKKMLKRSLSDPEMKIFWQ